MSRSFLTRRTIFGLPGALLILLVFFFLLPSVFRGARLAIAGKKNNIKDWLPGDFRETVELDWFARYFMGESFIVATWEGCTSEDQRLRMLSAKLVHESTQRALPDTADHERARQLAEDLQLFLEPTELDNWGGGEEKWFSTPAGDHYYLTPDGKLHRWTAGSNAVGGLLRFVQRLTGSYELRGQFVAGFGNPPGPDGSNEFYDDPTMLAASLYQTVQTGTEMVDRLAVEGGPLWPIDFTDADQRGAVARKRAIERLTGTMFAPALPPGFDWSPAAVHDLLPPESRADLPDDFDYLVRRTVKQIQERFGGELSGLLDATIDEQATAWDEMCQAIGVPVPPRQTCVLVTLTQLGKDHLGRSVGRGVVGGPRGRLLILADESGLAAAESPSMAPPPFDKAELAPEERFDADGRPLLRLGGPPVDNIAIDEEGTVTLVRLVGYSGLVGLGLSFLCFRSFNVTLMIFTVGLTAAVLGLAISHWTGGHVDAILMTMPSLVYVLGLSGAIHIVNYYRDEVRKRGLAGATARATHHAFAPCTLAAITTSLGLISLCTSNIVPIYNFGLYSAAAVMATLAILFTYLPAALETFPPAFALGKSGKADQGEIASGSDAISSEPVVIRNRIADFWAAVGGWVTAHNRLVTVVCLSVFALGLLGLPKIRTTVQLLKLFDSESRIISDYAYLESHFGKLVPMELVVRVPQELVSRRSTNGAPAASRPAEGGAEEPAGPSASDRQFSTHRQTLTTLQRAEAIGRIDTAVRRTLGESGTGVIGRTMSAITFMPPLPEPSNSFSPVRSKFEADLTNSLEELSTSDFFRFEKSGPFAGSELWRISLRVGALSDVDYGRFVGDLRRTVTPVLDAYRAREMVLSACDDAVLGVGADGGSVAGKRRAELQVVLLGHARPRAMDSEDFLAIEASGDRDREVEAAVADGRQSDLIRPDRLYASALGELLAGEPIRPAFWLDLDDEQSRIKLGDPRWQTMLERADVVVLLSDQKGLDPAVLAGEAKRFIDARPERFPVAEPILVDGVPTETNAGPLQAVYTGIVPVVYKAQRTLLTSLIESIVLAFFLIAFVMIALLIPGHFPGFLLQPRQIGCGIVAGMVAMVPNLFPVVVIFGLMGHTHTLVDIGTMMTASVAMGVAVDDTIHFLTWFRQHIDQGMSRIEAVIETYRRVGAAMTQTTIVGGLGLFVFSLSTFTPTQRFGTLMLVLLATALIGDLILLPALLAGPLGRWFKPRPSSHPWSEGLPEGLEEAQTVERTPLHASGGGVVGALGTAEGVVVPSPEDESVLSTSTAHRPPPDPIGKRRVSNRSESLDGQGSN
ncbi:MAG: hypothetical protein EA381_09085 [Planctomycetaceae bacterium]|nr:MAG: hypothetical protein EA381_09085 [Planctomycetaceae bacterium]